MCSIKRRDGWREILLTQESQSIVGGNVIYIHECQINPFYCSTKFARRHNGANPPKVSSLSTLSFSLSFPSHYSLALSRIFLPPFSIQFLSHNSHTGSKSLVDLFPAFNWPISLGSPARAFNRVGAELPLANLFIYLTLLLCRKSSSRIYCTCSNNIPSRDSFHTN